MELRIDRLLRNLRERPHEILGAIDADPLLLKRTVGDLVLANATKMLFSPTEEHHLYAKGIIYQRDPYRLVSLPLLKIYNLGEREVTVHDLARHMADGSRLRFLRKFDGTMIQRFQHDGRVYFTTRGVIEGAVLPKGIAQEDESAPGKEMFDYLGAAREIAERRYPALSALHPDLEGKTLVLELLHPASRVITDYGDREDLVLLTVFDRDRHAYWPDARVRDLAGRLGFTTTDAFEPAGSTIGEQIDAILQEIAATDEEGTVLAIESAEEVLYRVKVKSPAYLRLLKLMVHCTYPATVEMLDSFAEFPDWPTFEAFLKSKGSDQCPEEVMALYREHYDRFVAYCDHCRRLGEQMVRRAAAILEGIPESDPRARRKRFAALVQNEENAPLLFAAYDGRITLKKVREYVSSEFATVTHI
jgi:RNA ligase